MDEPRDRESPTRAAARAKTARKLGTRPEVSRASKRQMSGVAHRDQLGTAYKTVVSPLRLDVIAAPGATLNFLAAIRRAVLIDGRKAFVDLRPCELITPAGCIVLTAEIERCLALRPGSIAGRNPVNASAAAVLDMFGFHKHLKTKVKTSPRIPFIAQIRAGTGRIDDLPQTLGEVADLALEAWKDQALADRVHAALNEAMTNVLMHAYASDALDLSTCVPGRWWIAGLMDPTLRHAWFFALDQGAGIPKTATKTYSDLFQKYDIDPNNPPDGAVLAAAIEEGGSRTGLSQHGKGLPSMINLIKERASGGYVHIASRKGSYFYRKERDQAGNIYEIVKPGASKSDLQGTLIVWKVEGPK